MKHLTMTLIGVIALSTSGCVSNLDQVRQQATTDLKCPMQAVTVAFESRSQVGRTRYSAEGCDKQREYLCQKSQWFAGIPVGNATCQSAKKSG